MLRAIFVLSLCILLSACGSPASTPEPLQPEVQAATSVPTEPPTEASTSAPEPASGDAAWQSQLPPVDAAPLEVEITTADGRTLAGLYYPAKVNPAPIVVLMHWAGGDMTDWRAIAPWLQNRAAEAFRPAGIARLAQIDGPWLDPSWFPTLLPEASFGVLVFDYNGFGQSAFASTGNALLEDSLAAMIFASGMEGADPNMLVAAGASIGADGAVDGCYLFNEAVAAGEATGACLGALSLSPGNYLTQDFTYTEAVKALSDEQYPVFCLAGEGDQFSSQTCEAAAGDFYTTFIFPGDNHGMILVDPALTPIEPAADANALELLLDFLAMTIGRNVTP